MKKRVLSFLFLSAIFFFGFETVTFAKDQRTRNIEYIYNVQKDNLNYDKEKEILNLKPSGYMTLDEYEKLSEYKDLENLKPEIPKQALPADFKYIPKPLYKIVKYNDPPGSVELILGKRLYLKKIINTQGIVSPDFSKMVYSAVYYFPDSATVSADIFEIPLDSTDNNLNRILKASIVKRNPIPLLSTHKNIDNDAVFRSLTPVDFSSDGSKILVKEKIGSSEDGIWKTSIYVYDYTRKVEYDLSEIREAISYFWDEYMHMELNDKRWDIYPLGFEENNPNRIIVQGFAYTGNTPVFLGTWSIDIYGTRSMLVSFDINKTPNISTNGFKIINDGVEDYFATTQEEKSQIIHNKIIRKENKKKEKETIQNINTVYKYKLKELTDELKQDKKDNKKLQTFTGSTEDTLLEEAYKKYLIDQRNKDIKNTEKQIQKVQSQIDKIDKQIEKEYNGIGEQSSSKLEESATD